MGVLRSNRQSRASYSHDECIVEAEGKNAGHLRRRLDWLLAPKVSLTVTIRNWQPCLDCFAVAMYDVRTLLGAKKLVVDVHAGTIQVKVADPRRRLPLLGDDFDRLAEALDRDLAACRSENHTSHKLKAV